MDSKEWEVIEKKLKVIHGKAFLMCDGYAIELVLLQKKQFDNAIIVVINGKFPGSEILLSDCVERTRFCCKIREYRYPASARNEFKKMPKSFQRIAIEKYPDINDRSEYFVPYWTSFEKLKRHFEKHNKDIRLINRG